MCARTECNEGVLEELAGEYVALLRRRNYSDNSVNLFQRALKHFGECLAREGVTRVQDVGLKELERFCACLRDRSLSASTVHLYARTVRRFLCHLEERHLIFVNPAAGLSLPAPRVKPARVPTEAEVKALLEQPDTGTVVGLRDRVAAAD